jgi:hypothetical protein
MYLLDNLFQRPPRGEIPKIQIMYNDIEHSISIDFDIYIYIFQVFSLFIYLFIFCIPNFFFRKYFICHHLLMNFEKNK